MSHRLRAIKLAAADMDAAGEFLSEVCGVPSDRLAGRVRIPIDDAALVVGSPAASAAVGINGVEIAVDGMEYSPDSARSTALQGIDVQRLPDTPQPTVAADVILDHLAIAVRDLERSTERWETATGVSAELIGIHPASNGAFRAARLGIGERMVELVSPEVGVESALASRLDRVGEGPVVLALPAKDLDTKLDHLNGRGVRLVRQDPHWFVHPANPAHLLIQLTPRVAH